ncbi:MAG: UbiA family prenyltransferase [Flavobacteriales bacterium]|nr:UbiA family prenyltransferase [Flavobacteriales bacterium]
MSQKANYLHRIFSLFVHLRIPNLLVLLLALYFSSAYLFSDKNSLLLIFWDIKLHGIVWSSILSIGAGYLINYFYDLEKDKLEKPFTYQIKSFIKTSEILQLYLILNGISLLISLLISYKLFLFFIVYQFLIWFYCHKLSKILFINNLFSVILSLFPFIGLLIHFQKFDLLILKLGLFLTFLLFLKEIVKDVHSMTSDSIFNYKTLPNSYGITASKFNFTFLFLALIALSVDLSFEKSLSFMRLYFIFSSIIFIIPIYLMLTKPIKHSKKVELFIKIWTFIGILSILLIKFPQVFLHK